MKFVFFSPQFPASSIEFCDRLHKAGATVLGIGDASYSHLAPRLKNVLGEYYRVADMEDADQVLRAMGHFIHRWGRIDRFESLNEHWLEKDAAVRTDFNIPGIRSDFIENLKHKSKMSAFFKKAGVQTIRQHKYSSRAGVEAFVAEVGYPIVIKPDQGSGASNTVKIDGKQGLDAFETAKLPGVSYVAEEFIDGIVLTYDGLVDRDGQVVFAASHRFEQSIMDVVNTNSHLNYYCLPFIDPEVEEAGRAAVKAFGIREKFFHIEFFQTRADKRIVALEINMRPPGAWMTDAINYSYDMDVYREWAQMVVHNTVGGPFTGRYYTGYASRKNHIRYVNDHRAIVAAHGEKIVHFAPIEDVFSRAMGNFAYQFRSEDFEEVRAIVRFIQDSEC
ncbi:ATP-grasp domain-containing protein [Shinella sp. CPCC 101442]|uniref:ATP-grasp domain-containing protein n=1 Tax=Shinella sp. CPCC 101442 TaxID=2932265 RepID=UPI002152AC25|nr:ATP-grasp domain-containing protein [Shinella sp. CPCC 101442]MCR6498277.1 ATP-grasp domain-containing protein [Shinella sp. CPCC 101442]